MSQIRVRFAPSPTGYVHIGSLRTALYNHLFAKNKKGVSILRIEDTDQNRFVEGAIENLFKTMDWAGVVFDESVHKQGAVGPYQQSQRLEIYQKHIQTLLENGKAYPCFATAEELEKMREEQLARGEDPKYDGRYRNLPQHEAKQRMQEEAYVIRMRVPQEGETVIKDHVRGEVRFQNNVLDDQVLMKSDGFPTYHFANVVDDHLMGVTHVIRGEEWLPSTPKHVLLYQFFGWELPEFAHLPLLLNPDRSKLSKRQGDVAVEDYLKKGYLAEALVNYVALLGWSPGEGVDQEIFSMQQLVESFSLERVNKAGAVFDVNKLDWMNGQYIYAMELEQLVLFLTPFLVDAGWDASDNEKTQKVALAIQKRIQKGSDVAVAAHIFLSDEIEIKETEALEVIKQETAAIVLNKFIEKVSALNALNSAALGPIMKEIQKEEKIKGPLLWKPVRVALTGEISGPDLPLVIDVFGKEKVLNFVQTVIEKYI